MTNMADWLAPLYRLSKTGAPLVWHVLVDGDYLVVRHGQVGGKIQESRRKCEPKNVGRANETTAYEQARREAQALWNKQRSLKYSTDVMGEDLPLLPMLAGKFAGRERRVSFPVDVQPKLDGFRCLAKVGEGVVLTSRNGKRFDLPHIEDALRSFPSGLVLDGEIYRHGMGFQAIESAVKKSNLFSSQLEFHVFDVVNDDPWSERAKLLDDVFLDREDGVVKLVPVHKATCAETVLQLQGSFVSNGYEGAMVRTLTGKYTPKHRSQDLLKVKSFDDDEFVVVGAKSGSGDEEGCVVWLCETSSGKLFSARPVGTREARRVALVESGKYVGRLLKVRYFGLTDSGVPRFPVGVSFRGDFDL